MICRKNRPPDHIILLRVEISRKTNFRILKFSYEKLSPFLVQLLPLVTDLADFPEEEKNKFVPVVSILINIPKKGESYYDKTLMQINRVISELFFI